MVKEDNNLTLESSSPCERRRMTTTDTFAMVVLGYSKSLDVLPLL